jgi:hypothetical protein
MNRYSHEGASCLPVSPCVITDAELDTWQGRRIRYPQAVRQSGQFDPIPAMQAPGLSASMCFGYGLRDKAKGLLPLLATGKGAP